MRKYLVSFLVAGIIIFVIHESLAQETSKKPLTVDDFLKIHWISEPDVSPDGKLVAFTSTLKDISSNKIKSNIYVDTVFGDEKAKRFTLTNEKDFQPKFSPDGKTLAFLSTRSGTSQIWVMPINGGEPKQLTDFPTGINAFNWSPQGDKIAFVADVWVECKNDLKCLKKKAKETENLSGWIYKSLPIRVWNSWKPSTRSHLFIMPSDGKGEAVDITPWDRDVPPIDLGSDHDFVWSPDGKMIAFVMNDTNEVAWNTDNDVFLIKLEGGKLKKISESKGCDSSPYFSPDGKLLAFLSMERAGFEADQRRLVIHDLTTDKNRTIIQDFKETILDFVWGKDSKTIFFVIPEKARRAIYSVDITSEKTKKIYGEGNNSSLIPLPDGKTLIFLHESVSMTPNLFRIDTTKPAIPAQITFFNQNLLDGAALGTLEEFWFDGALGEKVHGLLLKPPKFDPSKKYPAIFLLHGGPQGDWDDSFHPRWNVQMMASRGHVLVMVNFHGSIGYGQAFTDSISGHWGDYPYEDIMKGLDYVLSHYSFIDPQRIGAAGASYGGYLANWILVNTDRFKAIFSHAGAWELTSDYAATDELWFPEWEFKGTPWDNPLTYEKFSPGKYISNLKKFKTPTLISHGLGDYRVTVEQGIGLFTILQRLGIESRLMLFHDEDHFVKKPANVKLFYETFLDWFEKHL